MEASSKHFIGCLKWYQSQGCWAWWKLVSAFCPLVGDFFFFVLPNNCHCHRSLISFFSEYLCCHRCWYWHQLEKLPSRSGKSLEVWGVQYLACNAIPLLEECLFMRTRKSCSCVTLLLEHQVQLLIKRKMAVS